MSPKAIYYFYLSIIFYYTKMLVYPPPRPADLEETQFELPDLGHSTPNGTQNDNHNSTTMDEVSGKSKFGSGVKRAVKWAVGMPITLERPPRQPKASTLSPEETGASPDLTSTNTADDHSRSEVKMFEKDGDSYLVRDEWHAGESSGSQLRSGSYDLNDSLLAKEMQMEQQRKAFEKDMEKFHQRALEFEEKERRFSRLRKLDPIQAEKFESMEDRKIENVACNRRTHRRSHSPEQRQGLQGESYIL